MKTIKLNLLITLVIFCLVITSIYCGQTNSQKQIETSSNNSNISDNDTCVGPDANINCCFQYMPDTLNHIIDIAEETEPGEKIIIKGTIFKEDGLTPYPNILIYSYHTDNSGYYSKKGNEKGIRKWHGYLYGWAKTDQNGKYELHSIRPGKYPAGGAPAHIHSAIKEPGIDEPYYINDFVFKDDNLVNEYYLSSLRLKGGQGVVDLKRDQNEILTGVRDIILK
ncbi:MAG: intradiol ring-cleavage dioxygenase [Ignavibacteria bacterium]